MKQQTIFCLKVKSLAFPALLSMPKMLPSQCKLVRVGAKKLPMAPEISNF